MNNLNNYSRQIKRLIGFIVIFLIILETYSGLVYIKGRRFSDAIDVSEQLNNEVIMLHSAMYNAGFETLIDALEANSIPKNIKIEPQYITLKIQVNSDVTVSKDDNLLVANIVNDREGFIVDTIVIKSPDMNKNLVCINSDRIVKITLTEDIVRLQVTDENKFYYTNFVKDNKNKICFVPGIVKKQDDTYIVIINVRYIKNGNALYFVNQIIKSLEIHSRVSLEGYNFNFARL